MSQRKLVLTARPDGQSAVEAVGFQGTGCTSAAAGLGELLGPDPGRVEVKDEYYVEQTGQARRQVGGSQTEGL